MQAKTLLTETRPLNQLSHAFPQLQVCLKSYALRIPQSQMRPYYRCYILHFPTYKVYIRNKQEKINYKICAISGCMTWDRVRLHMTLEHEEMMQEAKQAEDTEYDVKVSDNEGEGAMVAFNA